MLLYKKHLAYRDQNEIQNRLVVIFCYFGAFKWKLGDAPPQKGDWVGVINTT